MKKGFLVDKQLQPASIDKKPVKTLGSPVVSPSKPHSSTVQTSNKCTPRVVSTDPLIVCTESASDCPGPIDDFVGHLLFIPAHDPEIAILDRLPDCQQIARWPIWKTDIFKNRKSHIHRSVEVRDVPGKGRGMVAIKKIKAGTLIAAEPPTFVDNGHAAFCSVHKDAYGDIRDLAMAKLRAERRNAIMALKNAFPGLHEISGRLRTNNFPVKYPGTSPEPGAPPIAGCFEYLSMANHSCTPNASYIFDSESFCGQLWAMRDIKAGDEVTVQYVSPLLSRKKRNAELRENYNFTCSCSVCVAPEPIRRGSDQRRKLLVPLVDFAESNPSAAPLGVEKSYLIEALGWAEAEQCWTAVSRLRMLVGMKMGTEVDFTQEDWITEANKRKIKEALGYLLAAQKDFKCVQGPISTPVDAAIATLQLSAVVCDEGFFRN